MSEKWTIEQLFQSENGGNPFYRGPEEMYLWECYGDEEAHIVWRGYDLALLQQTANHLKRLASPDVHYCVEFPNRKGERDTKPMEKRKFDGGAKCLPNPQQRLLISMIERRWGATLDETVYMKTKGRVKQFYMRSDRTKAAVFSFETWGEVQQMAFTKRK